MTQWRLLDTPPMTAADNMALDEVLLDLKGGGHGPNTIRFLQFRPRAVLVGYHQSVAEEIRVDYCREHGIEINRRITGGGAIFFDENQLGWEVICDKAFFDVRLPTPGLFRRLCKPVVRALGDLGVLAEFRPRNDIEINGRKISGNGGTDSEDAFLFQGTMLVDFDVDTMLRALRIPVEKLKAKEIDEVKDRVTCLAWELDRVPDLDAIKKALVAGFSEELGVELIPGGLTDQEQRLFDEKRRAFAEPKWIDRVRPVYQKREAVQSAYKAEAGMVRFTLVVNPSQNRLKDVYITGDFLSFPSRALFDMEASLRGMPLDRQALYDAIAERFESGAITIPGMSVDDFVKPLDQALAKIAIAQLGLPLDQCNRISVTNGSFEDVMRLKPSVLLLPYCAKLTECDLRYEKECRICGEEPCTIGPAWNLGMDHRMDIVSVTSYEDLWDELMEMRDRGVPAFVGCCCQPFYAKHADDFERAGLPGILLDIDNTTCYDLDEAKKAYAGTFESQTHLDMDLLRAVLELKVS